MFETIADARKGTTAVNRIYKGNTLVWSRYNWEKWSCQKTTNYSTGLTFEAETTMAIDTRVSGRFFKRRAWSNWEGVVFSDDIQVANYPAQDLYTAGYVWGDIGRQNLAPIGDTVMRFTGLTSSSILVALYSVEKIEDGFTYSKGSTNYGIVTGNQGDYPSNGRHSDGYWYVSIGAMGFEEEEGNP